MALERRDPLPPGRYSFFVQVSDGAAWKKWTKEHSSTVKTVAAVPQKALASNNPLFATDLDGNIIQDLVGTLVLFDVTMDTPWVGLGFPDIEPGPQTIEAAREWAGGHQESKYIPPPGGQYGTIGEFGSDVLGQVKSLLLLGGAIYLAGAWLSRSKGKAS